MAHPYVNYDRTDGTDSADRRRASGRPSRNLVVAGAAAACLAAGAFAGCAIPTGAHATQAAPPHGPAAETAVSTGQVDRGLVDINTVLGDQNGASAGTGMVLTPGGEVLTNYHVISGATSITATDVANGRMYPATVVGYSRAADVAVLSLTGASGLPTVALGNSSGIGVGAPVRAFGNALGMGGLPSEATGAVTALNQTLTATNSAGGGAEALSGLIGTSAPIQLGDSGGPLVDAAGAVIGMDTVKVNPSPYKPTPTASFAIPINTARTVAAELTASSAHRLSSTPLPQSPAAPDHGRPLFGVEVANPVRPGGGTPVVEVQPGSPAASAGVVPGDTITSFNGRPVTSGYGLEGDILSLRPGSVVAVTWLRPSGPPHSARVALGARPAA